MAEEEVIVESREPTEEEVKLHQRAAILARSVQVTIEFAEKVALKLIETSPKSFVLHKDSPSKVCAVAFYYGAEFADRVYELIVPEDEEEKKDAPPLQQET